MMGSGNPDRDMQGNLTHLKSMITRRYGKSTVYLYSVRVDCYWYTDQLYQLDSYGPLATSMQETV